MQGEAWDGRPGGGCHLGSVPKMCAFPVSSCPHTLHLGKWSAAFLHAVIESSIFSLPHLLIHSESIYAAPYHVLSIVSATLHVDEKDMVPVHQGTQPGLGSGQLDTQVSLPMVHATVG